MASTRRTLHKEGLRPAFEEMRPRELSRRSKSSSRSTSRCDVLVTIDHILVFLKHFSVSTVLSRCVDADGDRYCRLLRCDRSPRGFVNVIRSGGGSNLQKVHASFKVASAAVEDRRKNASSQVDLALIQHQRCRRIRGYGDLRPAQQQRQCPAEE